MSDPTTKPCPDCNGKVDPPGLRLATCPGCNTQRWHGIGPCGFCKAPGTCCTTCNGEGRVYGASPDLLADIKRGAEQLKRHEMDRDRG